MALEYDFKKIDQKLDNLESAQAAQAIEMLAVEAVLDRLLTREAAGKRILKKRLARLRAMRTSLGLALKWGAVKGWYKKVRNDWWR